jgi:poly(hydroxyalkanoate) depolymerase family esterase
MKTRRTRALGLALVLNLCAALVVVTAGPASAATVTEVTAFGSNPGNLKLFKYVPDGLAANRPLVLMMHGCFQSHSDFDDESGWLTLADAWQFAVVFPETSTSNQQYGCFTAYDTGDNQRGAGEALSIKQMVDYMQSTHSSDPARTFVTGFSAGGWMTNVVLATYPDVFEAGAPMAGAPYLCATTQSEFESCNTDGKDLTPQQWGDKIRSGYPGFAGPLPKVLAIQGSGDTTVKATHLNETMEAWTNAHAIDQTSDDSTPLKGHNHNVHKTSGAVTKVETVQLVGMQHSVAVDPGTGGDRCGVAALSTADVNLCAAYYAGTFFGLNPGAAPSTASFGSGDANDGYVTAYSNGASPSVGTDEATNGLALGHRGFYRYDRAVLSFDTSSLPDGASINRVYLRVTKQGGYGDPWNDPFGNSLLVDVKTGCFGSVCTTESSDWAASPTASSTASVPTFPLLGGDTVYSGDFGPSGRAAVNKTGTTQLKLRFNWFQSYVSYVYLKRAADAQLVIEYS